MNAIKTENLDVYALVDKDLFVVSVLVDNQTIATFEYPIADLAKDVVASLSDENGHITGEDAEDAYETMEALDNAYMYINDYIKD
jgi:hypothetical protein